MPFFLRRTTAGTRFFVFLGSGFAQFFGNIVPIGVNTLGNTIWVTSGCRQKLKNTFA